MVVASQPLIPPELIPLLERWGPWAGGVTVAVILILAGLKTWRTWMATRGDKEI